MDPIAEDLLNTLKKHATHMSENELEYIANFISAITYTDPKNRQFVYAVIYETSLVVKENLERLNKMVEDIPKKKKGKVVN